MASPENTINWYSMSDPAIVAELGTRLKQIRLQQNLSQEKLAEKAGLSRSAISEMENGKAATSLLTIVQVLRVLDHLNLLDNWQSAEPLNPLQMVKFTGAKRLRATKKTRKLTKEEIEWEWLM